MAWTGSEAGGSSMLQVQKLGTNADVRNDTTAGKKKGRVLAEEGSPAACGGHDAWNGPLTEDDPDPHGAGLSSAVPRREHGAALLAVNETKYDGQISQAR